MKRSLETLLFALAAASAVMVTADQAKADIDMATVNQQGDLELDFRTTAPPNRQFQYTARASSATTYACPNAMFIRGTVTAVVTRNGYFTSDFQGWVNALLTLNLPPGAANINCPGFAQPVITRVEYRQIEIRGELGTFQYTRDTYRNFP